MRKILLSMTLIGTFGCTDATTPADPSDHPDGGGDADDTPPTPSPDGGPDARAAALWVLSHDATGSYLYEVDPLSFAVRRDFALGYDGDLWELAGSSPDRAYAIDREGDFLVAIDLESGQVAYRVPMDRDMKMNGRGFAVSPDGALYGNFDGGLARIDPSTGATSPLAPITLGKTGEALEFCDGGAFIASRPSGSPKGEKLYALDMPTGETELIGDIGPVAIDVDTMACGPNVQLYGADSNPVLGKTLIQIDPTTGTRIDLTQLLVAGIIDGLHVTAAANSDPIIE